VVAFGHLADRAFRGWLATPAAQGRELVYAHPTHPTQPEASSRGDQQRYASAMRAMLTNWNRGLELLFPAVGGSEVPRDLVPYGEALEPGDLAEIPAADLPAGLPRGWASSRRSPTARAPPRSSGAPPSSSRSPRPPGPSGAGP